MDPDEKVADVIEASIAGDQKLRRICLGLTSPKWRSETAGLLRDRDLIEDRGMTGGQNQR